MTTGAAHAATQRIEEIMGTAIVIDARDPGLGADAFEAALTAAFDHLRDVDARFSTYKPESEVCRLNRGEIDLRSCSPDLRAVLEMCEEARVASDGYFDIRAHRTDGTLDPSGLVKGWAADGAARVLAAAGIVDYCINAAGDIVTHGVAKARQPWRIGIRNPWDRATIGAVIEATDLAIATSGAYERGEHVIVPRTGRPPDGIASMTVVGHSLTWADAWATAAFAMGVRGVDWVARELDGYEACAISSDKRLVYSAGFERLMVEG